MAIGAAGAITPVRRVTGRPPPSASALPCSCPRASAEASPSAVSRGDRSAHRRAHCSLATSSRVERVGGSHGHYAWRRDRCGGGPQAIVGRALIAPFNIHTAAARVQRPRAPCPHVPRRASHRETVVTRGTWSHGSNPRRRVSDRETAAIAPPRRPVTAPPSPPYSAHARNGPLHTALQGTQIAPHVTTGHLALPVFRRQFR